MREESVGGAALVRYAARVRYWTSASARGEG